MKTTKILPLLGLVGALFGAAASAQPAPPDQPTTQGPAQDRPHPKRWDAEERQKALLAKYDTNKDGKLDDAELANIGRDVVAGKLDPRLAGFRPPRPGFGPPGHGPRGPGGPDFAARHQELLDKYDTNKDGKLDANERANIRRDIESGKLEPPPFGPGDRQGGFPPPPPEGEDAPPPPEVPQQ